MIKCRICKITRPTRDSMVDHLAEHSPRVLAEELTRAMEFAGEMQRQAQMAERCGKVGYKTEQTATNVLLHIWRQFGIDPIRNELRVYQCHRCEGRWHLTSQPTRATASEGVAG